MLRMGNYGMLAPNETEDDLQTTKKARFYGAFPFISCWHIS